MKTILSFLLVVTLSNRTIAQTTAIPDSNFEQELINLGYDTAPINGSVPTINISSINSLWLGNLNIADLTGIGGFAALTHLTIVYNPLISLDLSQNSALTWLHCGNNQLTSLDFSQNLNLDTLFCGSNPLISLNITQNTALAYLNCGNVPLTTLDVSQNTALTYLGCGFSQLTSLDLSQNSSLTSFNAPVSQLTCLNIKNGNNANITYFETSTNPNLTCIEVDNVTQSTINWVVIDPQHTFSTSCPNPCFVGIDDLQKTAQVSIYPNPTSEQLTISLEEASIGVLSIRNYLGQLVMKEEFNNTKELDISLDAPSGIYFLQLEVDGEVIIKKIIKE